MVHRPVLSDFDASCLVLTSLASNSRPRVQRTQPEPRRSKGWSPRTIIQSWRRRNESQLEGDGLGKGEGGEGGDACVETVEITVGGE